MVDRPAEAIEEDDSRRTGEEPSDIEIFREAQEGCIGAFEMLVRRFEKRIYNVAYRIVLDSEEASDLTQDIFLAVYRNLGKFRAESKVSTWIYRIAVNHALNRHRHLKRRGYYRRRSDSEGDPARGEAGAALRPEPDSNPEDEAIRRELRDIVRKELDALKEDQRALLTLRDLQGLPYEEIARALDLPEGTVKSRIHRARMELKSRLSGWLRDQ